MESTTKFDDGSTVERSRKILFLSTMNGAPWGGSEALWWHMAKWMASRDDDDVSACCYFWPEKQSRLEQLERAGCTVHLLPNPRQIKTVTGFFRTRHIVNRIPWETYDVVFISQGGWKDIARKHLRRIFKRIRKYIICTHSFDKTSTLKERDASWLRETMRGAFLNAAPASYVYSAIEEVLNIEAPRQRLLYNPITFAPPNADTAQPASTSPVIFAVFANLQINIKAQDVLIRALAADRWRDRDWRLRLYGEGSDKAILERLISELALDEKVSLKGFTNDVRSAIRECHLVVQATHLDAMPISLVEAMSMSRPCIVSGAGDMPAWIRDGVNGYICSEVTPERLEQTLGRAWNERMEWGAMGKRAFATFQEKYPNPYEEDFLECLDGNP
jgi:glycosyltransferase involved in cell wall biosynthesis